VTYRSACDADPIVEVPLLLMREQWLALVLEADRCGMTPGNLLRTMLINNLHSQTSWTQPQLRSSWETPVNDEGCGSPISKSRRHAYVQLSDQR
jgi:hypothetical protein